MEKDCGERENGNGFQILGCSKIDGSKQGILEEHDFQPYSPYGEKELMMKKSRHGRRGDLMVNALDSEVIMLGITL